MKGVLVDSLYAIYDTKTGKFMKFGSKVAWASSSAAKNAYACHNQTWKDQFKFDDQNRLIIVSVDAKAFNGELVDGN